MEEVTKKEIGQRINTLLAEQDKKQKELAEALGVLDNTISYFVSGKRVPNLEQIIKIAQFFDVSTDYLLGLSDNRTTNLELQAVCKYTGLSEDAAKNLHFTQNIIEEIKRNGVDNYFLACPETILPMAENQQKVINAFLEDKEFFSGCAYSIEKSIKKAKESTLLYENEIISLTKKFETALDGTKLSDMFTCSFYEEPYKADLFEKILGDESLYDLIVFPYCQEAEEAFKQSKYEKYEVYEQVKNVVSNLCKEAEDEQALAQERYYSFFDNVSDMLDAYEKYKSSKAGEPSGDNS